MLNLREFHGCGAFRVVVRHAVDPSLVGTNETGQHVTYALPELEDVVNHGRVYRGRVLRMKIVSHYRRKRDGV
jgi:hypothetical protein